MSNKAIQPNPAGLAAGRQADLLLALNAAAASLQRSAHSEAEVFRAFKEQIVRLGLRGGISLLDGETNRLVVRAIAYPGQILAGLEKLTGWKAEGFAFTVVAVDTYRQVVETGEAVFVPDSSVVIIQMLPAAVQPLAGRILKTVGSPPAIFAPLVRGGQVQGVMNIVGAGLTPDDVPPLAAFANHVAVALDNAHLFAALQQSEARLRKSYGELMIANEALHREIAEREQMEEALRESELKFRSVTQSANDAIISADSQGNIISWNKGARTIFGYAEKDVLGKPLTRLMPERYRESHQERLKRLSSAGKPRLIGKTVELHGLKKDGTEFPLELSLASWQIGEDTFFGGLIRDITERKRAEEEIRRRNRELTLLNRIIAAAAAPNVEPEALLETACRELAWAFDLPQAIAALLNRHAQRPGGVVVAEFKVDGRPSTLNRSFRLAGNPLFQHLLAHKAPLVVHDVRNDSRLATSQDVLCQRDTISLLILPLVIEGEVVGGISLEANEPRSFSAEEVSLAWSVADQVAGALARSRLTQTRQRLITAIEQAAESVIITDTEGAILYVNPAFERVSGYDRAEAIGQNPRILKSGKQDNGFYREMWTTLRVGKAWHGRFVNRRKDGGLYTEEATISPVRNEQGDIVSYVSVQRDVTHELELEEQYRQAQKMEAVGRLTGGVAHDFNNLLTAINGFAALLKRELPPDDSAQELVAKILHSGVRAADLVRQLLAFSRKQVIEPRVLSLNAVVTEMDKMLRRVIGEDIALETRLAPDLWRVKVDPTQIEQVIVNLAVNARDAMPGGGRLTIETANVILDSDYTARHLETGPGEHVLLTVSDTGFGMTEEVKAHLFEPFFTTKEQGKGTGLGLATVYGIVKQNNGHVWVYSEAGFGTTFKIYLPRTGELAAPVARPQAGAEMPVGSETVLLVEDDAAVRNLVQRVLQGLGYNLMEAQDGPEALQLAAHHPGPIHLLLTDVVMPGLSGKDLAQKLAAMQPGLKILYMSGYTDNAIAHHGVLEPGVAFLSKPFSPAALARKVRAVLDD